MLKKEWTLSQIDDFDEILDVRAPDEYARDHIPGAGNFPVLDDAQRADVGTVYKQTSQFAARKRGAPMVAANIARHLEQCFTSRDGDWQPLVYCWRGGSRSGAMVHVLNHVGWRAQQLPGGYRSYRRAVITTIAERAPQLDFRVLCGRTGIGKSRLLEALHAQGAQVLHLECLANHRGSVLGEPVVGEQPTQKWFESLLCRALRGLHPGRPVFVEAESRRIGRVQLPGPLIEAIRNGPCLRVEADPEMRVQFLLAEYRHFLDDAERLRRALARLARHVGNAQVGRWMAQHEAGEFALLVADLLARHYDPFYLRSMQKHFAHYDSAQVVKLNSIGEQTLTEMAAQLARMT